MFKVLRHLLSILILPFVATVLVPYGLSHGFRRAPAWPATISFLGLLLLLAGLVLFTWCVSLFARVGQGTLAPWDPTRKLVALGPYRYVRNPMISGVALILAGEALLLGSMAVGAWAVIFILINHAYFILSEEPGLEKRFGESYREYKRAVPRWFPRLGPRKQR